MNISKQQTLIIKAIAITLIVLHNFFNTVFSFPIKYNEFRFHKYFLDNTYSFIQQGHYISTFFIFFGYLGVYLFLFISAYGLSKRYNKIENYLSYLKHRILKIYKPYIISFFIFLIIAYIMVLLGGQNTFPEYLKENSYNILSHLLIIHNFFGEKYAFGLVGVWWFVSLIIQFYIIFPFLLKISNYKYYKIYFLIIGLFSILINYITSIYFNNQTFNMLYTIFGWMPIVLFGIYSAKNGINFSISLLLISIIVSILGYFNVIAWYFSFLAYTNILLYLVLKIKTYNFLIILGEYSMYIFLMHGIVQMLFKDAYLNINNIVMQFIIFLFYLFLLSLFVLFLKVINTKINYIRKH